MTAYYNDNNPFCVGVLRRRIADGSLPAGFVDDRRIQDIDPAQLAHAGQIHLFAGIGGFALGARLAGLPDDFPVITGGFPCQPFSVAGGRLGVNDDRYLWPQMFRVIRGVGVPVRGRHVVIENVPNIDGASMVLDRVCLDLEAGGYEVAPPFEIPAASVNRPMLRRRLWIVGRANGNGSAQPAHVWERNPGVAGTGSLVGESDVAGLAVRARCDGREPAAVAGSGDAFGRLAHTPGEGWNATRGAGKKIPQPGTVERPTGLHSYDFLECADGKYRRIPNAESGIQPMADGVSQRMARLEAIGNALVPQIAAEIFRAIRDAQ